MYKGKAIYQPKGKAGEYSLWACNLYNGCSNDCEYCYCKKGVLSHAMGGKIPVLKNSFANKEDALSRFTKELEGHCHEIKKDGGLFFSFSTDPCLEETFGLTYECMKVAVCYDVPVTILTKCTHWLTDGNVLKFLYDHSDKICVGFTLTGRDDMEPGASSNEARCFFMRFVKTSLHVKTFASIEPIVEVESSYTMMLKVKDVCDLFKVGLRSGVKEDYYDPKKVEAFVMLVQGSIAGSARIYWKESIKAYAKKHFSETKLDGVDSTFSLFDE